MTQTGPLSQLPACASIPAAPFGLDNHSCHSALFYLDEDFLTHTLGDFFISALKAGGAVITIATEGHRKALARQLTLRGMCVDQLKSEGRYLELEGEEILARCTKGRKLSKSKLEQLIGGAVAEMRASQSSSPLIIFGELVALLWAKRNFENLCAVEQFWDNLATRFSFSLLCGYPIKEFSETGTELPFLKICAMHSVVIPPDAYPTADAERRLLNATAQSYAQGKRMKEA